MLDTKYLRHHLDAVIARLETRGYSFQKEHFLQLESQRKSLQEIVQHLQEQANKLATQWGKRSNPMAIGTTEKPQLLEASRAIKVKLQKNLTELQHVKTQLEELFLCIPNLPDTSVPIGLSAKDNQEIRRWGDIPTFDFTPKDHVALAHGPQRAMDFESAARITGSRFVVLQGPLARLQRALTQWMLEVHTQEHGYTEVAVPYLVNDHSLQGTGQLPGFEEDLFKLHTPNHWYLIPTGEVPLTNLGRDRVFAADELPVKYVAYTPCFRSEAGSYGKDVRGMIRQHQFDKVELVQFVAPEQAVDRLELLTHDAEVILQRLALPYRVIALCTVDLGFAAAKTYDLEVWLPGQSVFREVSSCSYMNDFQARRLHAKWRPSIDKSLTYLHTLNGSGLAVGRTLVALLENYQQEDGSIQIPEVLKPYMGGLSKIYLPDLEAI
jgi:seryl-tRNA synthetase